MKNILAIGAHFDDVELGAGGTLAKWSAEGAFVLKLTLTDNVTKFDSLGINVSFDDSIKQSKNACKILGIKQIEPEKYLPCTNLEYSAANMQMVEKIIFDYNIDTVLLHFPSDMQQDHVEASRISYVAARYCPRVIYYQSNRYLLPKDFYPRFFVNITSFLSKKFDALKEYKGDHDRLGKLFEHTKLQNQIWGHQMEMRSKTKLFAEGFKLHKWVY